MRFLGSPSFRNMLSGKIGLWLLITWLHSWTFRLCSADASPTCQASDLGYMFTECDEEGGRWRVSVPKPGVCVGGAPSPPVRINCSFYCEEGYFLNRGEVKCESCAPGTFSLGQGLLTDTWTDPLPRGFEAYVENVSSSFRNYYSPSRYGLGDTPYEVNCSEYAWKPMGKYISSDGGPCSSILSYSIKLFKSGFLTFEYQHVDDLVLFTFEVQDGRCRSASEEKARWPDKTVENEWRTIKVNLDPGRNVMYWKTVAMGGTEYFDRTKRPVRIRNVTVMGVAHGLECYSCPPGTYSPAGAGHCNPCPENTYSSARSSQCITCNDAQYAPVGSEKCLIKPACTSFDYYQKYTQCTEAHTSTISYEWREPKICKDDLNTSVKLPSQINSDKCMECNPGMKLSTFNNCTFCPAKSFSTGTGDCKACPASTSPNYGLFYHVWHQIPPYITMKCISITDRNGCGSSAAWIQHSSQNETYVRSAQGHSNTSYLLISLDVPGFRSKERQLNAQAMEIGLVSFTFELECVSNCQLVFMEASSRNDLKMVKFWEGKQKKQTFSYSIRRNDTYNFTWAFQKVRASSDSETSSATPADDDVAKIYDITVTNTVKGGASECTPCPKGTDVDSCVLCPPGHYLDHDKCKLCPADTYIADRMPVGRNACKHCGAGLKSEDRVTCYSDCTLNAGARGKIDLRNLPKFMTVEGSSLFTSSGLNFHYIFNISLCGSKHVTAECVNNATSRVAYINSSICRSTIVPAKMGNIESIVSAQSVSIGDWLIGVTSQSTYERIKVHEQFTEGSNIHFYYISNSRTPTCLNGRNTTVTLRCDPDVKDPGEISVPHGCPDGTCDGCGFHFLWKTRRACRICNKEDYRIVKEECKHGSQEINYMIRNPSNCIPNEKDVPKNKIQPCSVISFELQSVIAGSVGLGVLLVALLFYCWKKNRKLEYKYMKLVQSGSSKEGELPTAESCAIYDDDDDQYDAVVASGTGRSSLLSKFQSGGRGVRGINNDDSSERIHLTKNRSQL